MHRPKPVELAALGGPLALIGLAHVAMTPLSAEPTGATPGATPILVAAAGASAPLTTEQRRAADWARAIDIGAGSRSPMDHPVVERPPLPPAPVTVVTPTPHPEPAPSPPKADPLRGWTLSGTMQSDRGVGMAAINGRIFRVGEEVVPGIALKAVDTRANQVTLQGKDGTVYTLGRAR